MNNLEIESKAFNKLLEKIDIITDFILSKNTMGNEIDIWVDTYEVCTFLRISERTLQRLKSDRLISYSLIKNKSYFKITEIKRMLEENLIKSDEDCLKDLITNHIQYDKQRKGLRKDK